MAVSLQVQLHGVSADGATSGQRLSLRAKLLHRAVAATRVRTVIGTRARTFTGIWARTVTATVDRSVTLTWVPTVTGTWMCREVPFFLPTFPALVMPLSISTRILTGKGMTRAS